MITHVTNCIHSCPLFTTSMNIMVCGHPDRIDNDPYIISQDNGRKGVPPKCPLRSAEYTLTIKLLVPNKSFHADNIGNKRSNGNGKSSTRK